MDFLKRLRYLFNLDKRAFDMHLPSFKKDGYFGYQVSGQEETTTILKKDSDLASFALRFAIEYLAIDPEEAMKQVRLSLYEKKGEIYLANSVGERYLLRQGDGHTVKYKMINSTGRPVVLDAPGVESVE